MRLSRRRLFLGVLGAALIPRRARPAAPLRLTLTGQALIQYDLRRQPWPDLPTIGALLDEADVCFTDLETAIRGPRAEAPTRRDVFLHAADAAVLDCLKDWHIGLLATANNHAYDLGTGGILGAIEELDRRGLAHAGSGGDLAGAAAPAYVATASGRVALVAGASGAIRDGGAATASRGGVNELRVGTDGDALSLNGADAARFLASIRVAAGRADIVIAYHHNHVLAGKGRRVPAWQRDFAHRCIEAGATLFVSHGAPWLLGIELFRGRPIFYNLGNLVFQTATAEGTYEADTWRSVVAACRFGGGALTEMTLTPLQLNPRGIDGDLVTRGRPSIARGIEAAAILDSLGALSEPFGTTFARDGDTAVIRMA